MRIIFMRTE